MRMNCISCELKVAEKSGFPYVVAQFAPEVKNKRMIADIRPVTLNITAPYSICTEAEHKDKDVRNEKYTHWLEDNYINDPTVKTDPFEIGSWDVEVEPYLRYDSDNKIIKRYDEEKGKDVPDIRNTVTIYGFCSYDDEGNELPLSGMESVKRRAKDRIENSKRIITVAKYNEKVKAAKEAKEAEEKKKRELGSDEVLAIED